MYLQCIYLHLLPKPTLDVREIYHTHVQSFVETWELVVSQETEYRLMEHEAKKVQQLEVAVLGGQIWEFIGPKNQQGPSKNLQNRGTCTCIAGL